MKYFTCCAKGFFIQINSLARLVKLHPFIHRISNYLVFAFSRARHPASAAHSVGGHTLYIVLYWTMSFVNESLLFLLATHMHETMKAFSSNMTTIKNVQTAE